MRPWSKIAAAPLVDASQIRLLGAISGLAGVEIRIRDQGGRIVWAVPAVPQASGVPAQERMGAAILEVAPSARSSCPERGGRLAAKLAGEVARCWRADAQRRSRRSRLTATRAHLQRDLALARLFAWDEVSAQVPDIVSTALTATVAADMGSGWTLVGLAGRGFTYAEPAGEDADRDPPPGWTSWDDLAFELHGLCPGAAETWFTADLLGGTPEGTVAGESIPLRADGLPVVVEGRVAGFVAWLRPSRGAGATHPAPLSRAKRRLLERLGRHAAQRLGVLQLQSEMLGFLFTTLKSLVAAVDAKDHYTRGHSERVHYLAVRAGEVLDLDPQALRDLSYAALLHDIGKIGIARAILTKTTTLTPEEWDAVRRHPERGCKVVEPIPQLAGTMEAIRHHHEHYDGSGYPDGLAGEAIPLLARIIAVADAFDAITSQRTYSKSRSCEDAVAILRLQVGRLFDPRAVEAVAQVVSQELSAGTLSFEVQRASLDHRGEAGLAS
jgi:hypothetical protein